MAVHLLNKQLEWTQLYWSQQPILNQYHMLWLNTVGKYRMKKYAYEIVRLQECAFNKMCVYQMYVYENVRFRKCALRKMCVYDTERTVTGLISRW